MALPSDRDLVALVRTTCQTRSELPASPAEYAAFRDELSQALGVDVDRKRRLIRQTVEAFRQEEAVLAQVGITDFALDNLGNLARDCTREDHAPRPELEYSAMQQWSTGVPSISPPQSQSFSPTTPPLSEPGRNATKVDAGTQIHSSDHSPPDSSDEADHSGPTSPDPHFQPLGAASLIDELDEEDEELAFYRLDANNSDDRLLEIEEQHLQETLALSEQLQTLRTQLQQAKLEAETALKALRTQVKAKMEAERRAQHLSEELELLTMEREVDVRALVLRHEAESQAYQAAQTAEVEALQQELELERARNLQLQQQLDERLWNAEHQAQLEALPWRETAERLLHAETRVEVTRVGQHLVQLLSQHNVTQTDRQLAGQLYTRFAKYVARQCLQKCCQGFKAAPDGLPSSSDGQIYCFRLLRDTHGSLLLVQATVYLFHLPDWLLLAAKDDLFQVLLAALREAQSADHRFRPTLDQRQTAATDIWALALLAAEVCCVPLQDCSKFVLTIFIHVFCAPLSISMQQAPRVFRQVLAASGFAALLALLVRSLKGIGSSDPNLKWASQFLQRVVRHLDVDDTVQDTLLHTDILPTLIDVLTLSHNNLVLATVRVLTQLAGEPGNASQILRSEAMSNLLQCIAAHQVSAPLELLLLLSRVPEFGPSFRIHDGYDILLRALPAFAPQEHIRVAEVFVNALSQHPDDMDVCADPTLAHAIFSVLDVHNPDTALIYRSLDVLSTLLSEQPQIGHAQAATQLKPLFKGLAPMPTPELHGRTAQALLSMVEENEAQLEILLPSLAPVLYGLVCPRYVAGAPLTCSLQELEGGTGEEQALHHHSAQLCEGLLEKFLAQRSTLSVEAAATLLPLAGQLICSGSVKGPASELVARAMTQHLETMTEDSSSTSLPAGANVLRIMVHSHTLLAVLALMQRDNILFQLGSYRPRFSLHKAMGADFLQACLFDKDLNIRSQAFEQVGLTNVVQVLAVCEDEGHKAGLVAHIIELFEAEDVCDDVVHNGAITSLVALGEVAGDMLDLHLFAAIMQRVASHSTRIRRSVCLCPAYSLVRLGAFRVAVELYGHGHLFSDVDLFDDDKSAALREQVELVQACLQTFLGWCEELAAALLTEGLEPILLQLVARTDDDPLRSATLRCLRCVTEQGGATALLHANPSLDILLNLLSVRAGRPSEATLLAHSCLLSLLWHGGTGSTDASDSHSSKDVKSSLAVALADQSFLNLLLAGLQQLQGRCGAADSTAIEIDPPQIDDDERRSLWVLSTYVVSASKQEHQHLIFQGFLEVVLELEELCAVVEVQRYCRLIVGHLVPHGPGDSLVSRMEILRAQFRHAQDKPNLLQRLTALPGDQDAPNAAVLQD
ncbi:uncharacterized protein MONBRDRAFT_9778 [Monosiga brevicollis MX1]|uniref:Uncharacterized protein n=1 Tax=Monosiga brevicollis TaxID=81824 RepID=A9V472_MONBE|nr:uncharacterized protein MONBRDRAFT_9778 [Monosiga brevicollis MX1]EDQ87568.1 predicted protein [Monosiga brevicollis MX1]|eukprot:XP_001747488.1 hypothetical protein [Monosiga brevicollis MX1]